MKYHNKKIKTKVNGQDFTFDSKKEYLRYIELEQMLKDGEITDLQLQKKFELVPKQMLFEPYEIKTRGGGKRIKRSESAINYIADFVYRKDGKLVVEDVKGVKTPVYQIKKRLMLYRYEIQIKEV